MFHYDVVSYQDSLYKVIRVFNDHKQFPVPEMKEYLFCDTVLRKEGKLYLCRKIQEAVIIEDNNEQVQLVEEGTQESEAEERTKGEVKAATTD
jgi:hypothetical protein